MNYQKKKEAPNLMITALTISIIFLWASIPGMRLLFRLIGHIIFLVVGLYGIFSTKSLRPLIRKWRLIQ